MQRLVAKQFEFIRLSFPNRVVPTSEPGDKELEVTVADISDRKYRVIWKDIAEIKLYEQMIEERPSSTWPTMITQMHLNT